MRTMEIPCFPQTISFVDLENLYRTRLQQKPDVHSSIAIPLLGYMAWPKIATKIEELAGKAEASAFRKRGNIPRAHRPGRPGSFVWPVLIDVCIYDLDYLKALIHDYTRGRDRK